jgi:hypothetical protein
MKRLEKQPGSGGTRCKIEGNRVRRGYEDSSEVTNAFATREQSHRLQTKD